MRWFLLIADSAERSDAKTLLARGPMFNAILLMTLIATSVNLVTNSVLHHAVSASIKWLGA